MANLTLTIDDEVLHRARVRALANKTSVNAIVREYLVAFSGVEESANVGRAIVALARESSGSSGPGGRTWTRDDIYER